MLLEREVEMKNEPILFLSTENTVLNPYNNNLESLILLILNVFQGVLQSLIFKQPLKRAGIIINNFLIYLQHSEDTPTLS